MAFDEAVVSHTTTTKQAFEKDIGKLVLVLLTTLGCPHCYSQWRNVKWPGGNNYVHYQNVLPIDFPNRILIAYASRSYQNTQSAFYAFPRVNIGTVNCSIITGGDGDSDIFAIGY
jgi:hypothetical protein